MLFNSIVFVLFFTVVYGSYLLLRKHYRLQNRLLLTASYVFYGFWDWRFLSLIGISTVVDYFVGKWLHTTEDTQKRKILLATSILVNLSILGSFKYFDFFSDSFVRILGFVGFEADFVTLRILLPVGISFYTFQTMSYTIDIYRRRLDPTNNFFDFALFVSFFPQLVAGPIERARNLLPQITSRRQITADQINAALFLILWGYFKKVVIADNVGIVADRLFNGNADSSGVDVLIGFLAFTIQIYGDFSGYSDIARGIGKLLGFELMVNFKLPYFALSPSDFWQRWHVSLSSWLKDYLYIPLGGNRGGSIATYRNLSLTMLLGGLWHGAAWTFVLWGAYHGAILIIYRIVETSRFIDHWKVRDGPIIVMGQMSLMFSLTVVGWVIFRSTSVDQIVHLLTSIGPQLSEASMTLAYRVAFFALPFLLIEIYQHKTKDLLILSKVNLPFRATLYTFFFVGIIIFGVREPSEFIYFQF